MFSVFASKNSTIKPKNGAMKEFFFIHPNPETIVFIDEFIKF
mgnify:CR=1 FL=1